VVSVVQQVAGNVPSLSDGLGGFRLILHVLAATIWVGGQFTLAGLVPTLRTFGEEAPKTVARAFARLLWPAYVVLVVTGFWNIGALTVGQASSAWKAVLMVKIAMVVVAGVGVFLHQRSTTRLGTAIWGAVGALASVAALCLGVFLAG
jgi:putative copper export protein